MTHLATRTNLVDEACRCNKRDAGRGARACATIARFEPRWEDLARWPR